jgi:hypothetical protein
MLNENAPASSSTAVASQHTNLAAGNMDNWDVFGLLLPLSFDGFKVTPYAIFSQMGPRALSESGALDRLEEDSRARTYNFMYPRWYATHNAKASNNDAMNPGFDNNYVTTWWAAVTGEVTAVDPLRIAWEAM